MAVEDLGDCVVGGAARAVLGLPQQEGEGLVLVQPRAGGEVGDERAAAEEGEEEAGDAEGDAGGAAPAVADADGVGDCVVWLQACRFSHETSSTL